MIRTNYDWMVARDALQEVSLAFGADEIKLSNNEIGLFEIKDIDIKVSKLAGVSGTNMIANAAFIEIHRSCVAEIEFILQTCQNNGNGMTAIVVESDNCWDNDIFSRVTCRARAFLFRCADGHGQYFSHLWAFLSLTGGDLSSSIF